MSIAKPGTHVAENEPEVPRPLVDVFSHPTPALTRLIEHVRQNPELAEGRTTGCQTTPMPIRDRQEPPTSEANSATAPASRRESTKRTGRAASPAPSDAAAPSLLPLVVDYANGLTQAEIARKHGLHVQTLRKRLREAEVNTRVRVPALSENEVKAARAVIFEGASARAVARRLGVAHTTLLRALKRPSG